MEREHGVLRIEFEESPPNRTTLKLTGRLGSGEIATLCESVDPLLDSGCEIALDLSALRFVDDQAARVLLELRERRAELRGARGYVAVLLRTMENES